MKVENRTSPFGTILIIYESRPDVTIEAAGIAFKSGNKILLKGGKEAKKSNLKLTECWHNALTKNGLSTDNVQYLNYTRLEIQEFLKSPNVPLDLIVPRGGEKLIQFVRETATCPVLVSGRGNNFLYVSDSADLKMAKEIILNGKLTKISACNALDKVLINSSIDSSFIDDLQKTFIEKNVALVDLNSDTVWEEEFLDYKIGISTADTIDEAINLINKYSGGHSATIVTEVKEEALHFMTLIDCAAVYHNASTRFTDGGQFGMGAELAISTEKMHHRGPLGLDQLVTNKWFVYGNGQIR
jgi:glutamate-5-semialdehyde dehydrogenase